MTVVGRAVEPPDRSSGLAAQPVAGWRAALALAGMELRLTLRRGENLLVTLVIPAVVLVFFATVSVLPAPDGRAVDFLLPGSLALAVIATSMVSLGIATGYERSYGVLKRLGGAPLSGSSLVAAKILAVLVVELVQAALLVGMAVALLGWRPPVGSSLPALVAALLLGSAAFGGLGLLMAGRLRAEATLAIANGLFLAFLLLGGIVIPATSLPDALASLAALLPAGALADAFRAALGGDADLARALITLLAWGGITAGLAVRTFRWE
jgi:ABC-2 type transport system permease protein